MTWNDGVTLMPSDSILKQIGFKRRASVRWFYEKSLKLLDSRIPENVVFQLTLDKEGRYIVEVIDNVYMAPYYFGVLWPEPKIFLDAINSILYSLNVVGLDIHMDYSRYGISDSSLAAGRPNSMALLLRSGNLC